jgi:transcriptional regulator with XRE-family HTH domain
VALKGLLPLRYKGLKELKNPIGARIKMERERLGVSQSDIAHDVGVSAKAMSQIETGKVSPRKQTIIALEKALGLEPGELYAPDTNLRPSVRQMQELITGVGETLPYGALALVLERFSKEAPEVRAATLAVLYGDPSISDLGVSADKAKSR